MKEEYIKLLPAVIAFSGVLLGSLITYLANLKIKSTELNHQVRREHSLDLRKIYSKFISEANVSAMKSLESKDRPVEKMEVVNGLLAQIELLGSEEAVESAKMVVDSLLNMYAKDPDCNRPSLVQARNSFIKAAKLEITNLEIN